MQLNLLNEGTNKKPYLKQVRETVSFYGTDESSLQDLFAILVGKEDPTIAQKLATITPRELVGMTIEDFLQVDGVTKKMAERIECAIALSKKLYSQSFDPTFIIRSPEDAYRLFNDLKYDPQEKFVVAYLNTKNHVIAKRTIFIGSLNSSIVHPREIFREAIKISAASLVCCHQHPSGDPAPSKEDIQVTKRLVEVGDVMGIQVLDHIIIGDGRWVSLKEKGYV